MPGRWIASPAPDRETAPRKGFEGASAVIVPLRADGSVTCPRQMADGRFDSKHGREAGKKGGPAKARRKLTLDRVEAELGDLETLEEAQRWLRSIGIWAMAGMVPGTVANAAVRSVDVWLRAHESKLTRELMDKLRARVEDMEAQVKRSKMGVR